MQNMNIRKSQGGFTLIELVIVIVLLGILAAVAVPRFIDLSDEAETASVQGVAGAMASAMAINYAGCAAKDHSASADECVAISDCNQVGTILEGGTPTGYFVPSSALTNNGTTASCSVGFGSSAIDSTKPSASFQGIGAGQ